MCVFLYLIKFTTKYSVGGLTHNSRRCSETKEVQLLEKLLPCCVMWNFINIAKSFHFFCLYFWPNQAGTYPLIVLMLEYKDLSCFRLTALEYHRKVRQKFTDYAFIKVSGVHTQHCGLLKLKQTLVSFDSMWKKLLEVLYKNIFLANITTQTHPTASILNIKRAKFYFTHY